MNSSSELEQLQADASYYRDRIALLRARLYRWGLRPNSHLKRLERNLARTEQRLREKRQQT